MRRRRRLRNAPSSKSELVESLLRLGDIARNNQVGEVTVALDKAKQLIDKYGLSYLQPTYQKLVDKVAAFQRGEKVERDDESQSSHRRSTSDSWQSRAWQDAKRRTYSSSGYSRSSGYTKQEREQTRKTADDIRRERARAKRDARERWKDEHKRKRRERREQEKAQARAQKKASAAGYKRPKKSTHIEWLWTKTWSPKRGKAGERWKAYYGAATIEEMLAKGGRWSDVKWNITHNLMRIKD